MGYLKGFLIAAAAYSAHAFTAGPTSLGFPEIAATAISRRGDGGLLLGRQSFHLSRARHDAQATRLSAGMEAGVRPAQDGQGGTLSDEAKTILKEVMQKPMFAVDSVGGGACREAFFSRRYLNGDDLAALQRHADAKGDSSTFLENKALVTLLESRRNEVVAEGKRRVDKFPGIYEPGGGLYPPIRAQRCEEDFHAFLQLACYATAANEPSFSDPKGADLMCSLYREMQVPLDPMVAGVEGLRDASQKIADEAGCGVAFERSGGPSFEHLLSVLVGIRSGIEDK